nr:MAG TPA: hypothetical protein [Caudoviricetes sp.]
MQYCKHRFWLIEGDLTNLDDSTENAEENLKTLYKWLSNSDIGDFFSEFMMAKTGEKISVLMNAIKFGYNENYYDEDLCIWMSDYTEYSNEELKEKYNFEHKEIQLEEFLNLIDNSIIVIGEGEKNFLFDVNKKYYGTYIGKRTKFKGYGLQKLKENRYNYTKSQYLLDCYNLYNKTNIKTYNEKMKEIMK